MICLTSCYIVWLCVVKFVNGDTCSGNDCSMVSGCVNLKIPVQFINGGTCSGNDLYGGWLWHNGSCDSCY